MTQTYLLGIDMGGTHTDAALIGRQGDTLRLLGQAKAHTRHDDLPASVCEVLATLRASLGDDAVLLEQVGSVTLGTTLAVNALVQGKADRVGLALSAGPGLAPGRFALGEDVCIVPGGLDHRGVEVTKLDTTPLREACRQWKTSPVAAVAVVGKFSPRNPAHESAMAQCVQDNSGLPVTLGHRLSGQLNFPRRIATAYYNAAVARLHGAFLDAVEQALRAEGINVSPRLLKADGGAIPAVLAREEPVQSILSGPAASVMGVMALCPQVGEGCSLLLDIGGTTTDMAIFVDGSPAIDRDGMSLMGRRTLVRALATTSIGVGGDSLIAIEGQGSTATVHTGPVREGPAMAFGGARPTLLDACNTLDAEPKERGDIARSRAGLAELATAHGMDVQQVAALAVNDALVQIQKAVAHLLGNLNSRPIYTLAALRAAKTVAPERVMLVGGPAHCLQERVAQTLGLLVIIPDAAPVANAVGAALTLPTASLELYADTGRGQLRAPSLDVLETIGRNYTLDAAKVRASELLQEHLAASGVADARVEVVEADMFATLDDGGYGSKDLRVTCQVVPGIVGVLQACN